MATLTRVIGLSWALVLCACTTPESMFAKFAKSDPVSSCPKGPAFGPFEPHALPLHFVERYPPGNQSRMVEQVDQTFQKNPAFYQPPYSAALGRNPCASGEVAFAIAILPTGAVAKAEIIKSSMNDAAFDREITERVLQTNFGHTEGSGYFLVLYPMRFSSFGQ